MRLTGVAAALILSATTTSAYAATDPMDLMRSMPCGYLRDMLMPLHDDKPPETFVTENSRFIAADSWTPELLQLFDDRVRKCVSVESRAMVPFGAGSMLRNYLRLAEMGMQAHRQRLAVGDPSPATEQPSSDPMMRAVEQARARQAEIRAKAEEVERLSKENQAKRAQAAAEEQDRRRKLEADRRRVAVQEAQQRQAVMEEAQRRRQMAQADSASPSPPTTPSPTADDCPFLKAHEADLAPLMAKMKDDGAKMEGKSPAELALAPELACNALNDEVATFKAMLGYAQECPADSRSGGSAFRNNAAGMVLQLQSQGRQMGCR